MIFDSFFDAVLSNFSHDLAVDLGSENLRIAVKNKGVAVNEPFYAFVERKYKKILFNGHDAKKARGRVSPSQGAVVRPIYAGAIQDFDVALFILKKYIVELHRSYGLIPKIPKPKILFSALSNLSPVEKKALKDVFIMSGARKVVVVPGLLASAIGSGFDLFSNKSVFVVNFGAEITEIGVVSIHGIDFCRVLKVGSRNLNTGIVNFIKLKYGILIGDEMAENIKISIACLHNSFKKPTEKFFVVRGRDMESFFPRSIKISSKEIDETLRATINLIIEQIREIINQVKPELLFDFQDLGIFLTGGGSRLFGLSEVISEELKINSWVVKDPEMVNVKGLLKILEDPRLLERIKKYEK